MQNKNKSKFFYILLLFFVGIILISSIVFEWDKQQMIMPDFENRFERVSKIYQLPSILSVMAEFIAIYVIGFLSLHFFPKRLEYMGRSLDRTKFAFVRIVLVGFLAFLMLIPIGIFLSSSPTTILLAFTMMVFTYLSGSFGASAFVFRMGYEVHKRIKPVDPSPLISLLMGDLIISAFLNLPYLGTFLRFILLIIGIGMVLSTRYGSGRSWHISSIYQEGN